MSDTPQPDYWQASDGKWYPPPAPGGDPDESTASDADLNEAAPVAPPILPPEPIAADQAAPSYSATPQSVQPAAVRTQSNGSPIGVLITLLGWVVFVAGVVVAILILNQLQDQSEFLEPTLTDYMTAMTPGFLTAGIGLVAAATGSIASRV